MKKVFPFLLTLLMLFTLSISSFANDIEPDVLESYDIYDYESIGICDGVDCPLDISPYSISTFAMPSEIPDSIPDYPSTLSKASFHVTQRDLDLLGFHNLYNHVFPELLVEYDCQYIYVSKYNYYVNGGNRTNWVVILSDFPVTMEIGSTSISASSYAKYYNGGKLNIFGTTTSTGSYLPTTARSILSKSIPIPEYSGVTPTIYVNGSNLASFSNYNMYYSNGAKFHDGVNYYSFDKNGDISLGNIKASTNLFGEEVNFGGSSGSGEFDPEKPLVSFPGWGNKVTAINEYIEVADPTRALVNIYTGANKNHYYWMSIGEYNENNDRIGTISMNFPLFLDEPTKAYVTRTTEIQLGSKGSFKAGGRYRLMIYDMGSSKTESMPELIGFFNFTPLVNVDKYVTSSGSISEGDRFTSGVNGFVNETVGDTSDWVSSALDKVLNTGSESNNSGGSFTDAPHTSDDYGIFAPLVAFFDFVFGGLVRGIKSILSGITELTTMFKESLTVITSMVSDIFTFLPANIKNLIIGGTSLLFLATFFKVIRG